MKVVAVVLNWKRPDDTIACVSSVRETSPDTSVIVVDNASGDGSVEAIRAAHPGIEVICNEANLGYAGGNNAGIRAALARADTDAIVILNNDVIVQPGCIEQLAAAVEELWPAHALPVAPISLLRDDPGVVDFFTARVDLKNMALIADRRDTREIPAEPSSSDYATGSAFMARREMFEDVGVFDEDFFLVWEDVDLCLRARRGRYGGHPVQVDPRARVLHGRSVSFGGDGSPLFQYFFVRNSFLIVHKHGRWPWKRRAHAMLRRRYEGWLEHPETTPQMRAAIALGLEHGLAKRWGPPPDELRG